MITLAEMSVAAIHEPRRGRPWAIGDDVGMKVLPEPLGAILVGAIGRQEARPNPRLERGYPRLRDAALVGGVLDEDEIDRARRVVRSQERAREVDERSTGFADPFDAEELLVQRLEGAGRLVLLKFLEQLRRTS